MVNARVRGHVDEGAPDEDQPKLVGYLGGVALEEVEQLLAALVLIDAAHVQDQAAPDPRAAAKPPRAAPRGDLGADPDDHPRDVVIRRHTLNDGALLRRVVHERPDAAEDGSEDRESEGRVALGGGDENGLRGRGPNAVVRVVVPVAEEDEVVVGRGGPAEPAHERRTRGSLGPQPPELVCEGVHAFEDVRRAAPELPRVAFPPHREAVHDETVDLVGTGRQLVAPRNVVAGARSENLDLRMPVEALRDVSRVELRPTVEVGRRSAER